MAGSKRPSAFALPAFSPFLLIVCAVFLTYLPAFHGALLWDDTAHVTRLDLRSWSGLWRIWTVPGATQQYYPLLHTAFWFEHRLWGDSVLGYHLLNIALHALAACLVVLLARRLTLPGAWLAGLLFAVHPLCVEAVAWISEQKSTLSAVFYFAAMLAYLKFDASRKRGAYIAAIVLFAAALLTKTVTAVLPAVLLVILWWRRGRLSWKKDVIPLTPLFLIGVCAGLVTAWVELNLIGASGREFALTPFQRCELAGRALWFYAVKILWPSNLAFFYPRWAIDSWLYAAAAIVAGALCWALTWPKWNRPPGLFTPRRGGSRNALTTRGPLASLLVFAATLFPALGFLNVYPFRYSYVADHFAYLAVPALVIPLAALLSLASAKFIPHAAQWLPGALCASVLAAIAWQQAGHFRDEETLYRATLAVNPAAWLAQNNLGNILLDRGDRSEALEHLLAALRLAPDASEVHLSMGNYMLNASGRLDDAIAEYRTAVRLAPASERAHANLGNALLRAGRSGQATAEFDAALRIDPSNAVAHIGLGNAFLTTPGRVSDAIAQYRLALAADPDAAEAHNDLGRALAMAPGQLPAAVAELETAAALDPDSWSARSNLGNALSMIPGRLEDAIAQYRAALRLNPDAAAVHNNLGFALSHAPGSLPEAISEYREAIRLAPDYADAHYNLAMALLQTPNGRPEALAELETVRRLKPGMRLPQ